MAKPKKKESEYLKKLTKEYIDSRRNRGISPEGGLVAAGQPKSTTAKEEALEILSKSTGGWLTFKDIFIESTCEEGALRRALGKLVQKGIVIKRVRIVNNASRVYFILKSKKEGGENRWIK